MDAANELTPILKAHREAMALELRALSLWADIQNAAQFLGRQARRGPEEYLLPGISFCFGEEQVAIVEAFAKVANVAALTHGPYEDVGGRRPFRVVIAVVMVNGVEVRVQSSRSVEVTP